MERSLRNSGEYDGKITFVTVNVDEQKKIAQEFGVSSVPVYMILDASGTPLHIIRARRRRRRLRPLSKTHLRTRIWRGRRMTELAQLLKHDFAKLVDRAAGGAGGGAC